MLLLALTLPEEMKIVWLGRPSLVKVLFVFNRYLAILFVAIDIATFSGGFQLTDKVFHLSSRLHPQIVSSFS
jgi:hypothetical protein